MDWNEFLRDAVAEKDAGLVRQALAQGADPNYSEVRCDAFTAFAGTTALYWAVGGGSVEIVCFLLEAGAKVAAEAQASASSLHAAVEDANLPMVNLLLDYDGAAALNWFDEIDRTPLMIAVEMEQVPIAQRLIEAGADVNAHDERMGGDAALHIAAVHGTRWNCCLPPGPARQPKEEWGLRRYTKHKGASAAMGRASTSC